MKAIQRSALVSLAVFSAVSAVNAAPAKKASTEPELVTAVREKLEGLPYYGVFDILSYQVSENGEVELSGFVFRDSLKKEAENAVLKARGVKSVVNRIEDLDWGVQDDEIRAKVYLTLYRDNTLSRYGTSDDMALASGFGFRRRGLFSVFGPLGIGNPNLPGFNPSGRYGIHILVSHGEVILVGQVDNEGDKILAEIRTRGVFPVRKVFNELSVKNAKPGPVPAPPPQTPAKRGIVAVAKAM